MKTLFVRIGSTIKNLETGEVKVFKSKSKAKKESRKIQLEHGVLGCGVLRVSHGR